MPPASLDDLRIDRARDDVDACPGHIGIVVVIIIILAIGGCVVDVA